MIASLALAGCQFRDDLTEIHASIVDLRGMVEKMNETIHSLQTLAEAAENNYSIASVTPVMENNLVTGHTVTFSNGKSITIIDGKYGEDVEAPDISIGQDEDSRFYWKLDGEWIVDKDGGKMAVTGIDAIDGTTPLTKIEEGYWYISFDEGKTWIQAGIADGEQGDEGDQGDNMIVSIDNTSSLDYVIFTMRDGSVIKIYTSDALETLQQIRRQLNSNILTISHTAKASGSGGYVKYTSVCVEDGETVGWILEMNDKTEVTAYNRITESSLWRPCIQISLDSDGVWKWEMDGERILGTDGKPVGLEVLPRLKVENNRWYASIDEGKSWMQAGNAVESENHSVMIKDIVNEADKVTISLGNGTDIVLNNIPGLQIHFSKQYDIPICVGKSTSITYQIFEGEGDPQISVITADHWEASIQKITSRLGVITIKSPQVWADEDVKVMVNCEGEVVMESLTFVEAEFAVTSVNIIQEEIRLYEGYSTVLEAIITPEDATESDLEWTSSNNDVAVVSPQGRVVAIKEGEAVITASGSGLSDQCRVIVRPYIIPVEHISIPTPQITIEENTSSHIYVEIEPYNATDKSASWESSDESIVEVSQTGTVKGLRPGEAVVRVTIGGLVAECIVTVIAETPDRSFTEIVKGVRFKMIHVKAGTFQMGDENIENARPVRDVTISRDYFIAETETTQELWEAFMTDNNFHYKGKQRPVDFELCGRVFEFISKLNEATGKEYRLPTEAEWEYAARGGNKSKGYIYSGSNDINEVAVWPENSNKFINPATGFYRRETFPVKSFKPNELGIYDMSGNVNEWCIDYYAAYPKEAETDPDGPDVEPEMDAWGGYNNSSYRVHRGGHLDWGDSTGGEGWKVAKRGYLEPGRPYDHYGFRLALTLNED